MNFCSFCKRKISSGVKKCPHCGLVVKSKILGGKKRARFLWCAAVALVICAVAFCLFRFANTSETIARTEEVRSQELTKKYQRIDITPEEIRAKLNSLKKSEALNITSLSCRTENGTDIYWGIPKNKDVNISIAAPRGGTSATYVTVTDALGSGKTPTAFISYCLGLMAIFTPTMTAESSQKILFEMMGYTEGNDTTFTAENTYIIAETKYTFTYSKQKGLSMHIEQMPELEPYSGDLPVM